MSSQTSPVEPRHAPTREELLEAHQRRLQTTDISADEEQERKFQQERDLRQSFRRLLDPGIMRGLEKKTALASIKTLLTIAENLLNHPENEKFHQFKPTNTIIKRNLVEVKGALEYAVEMGFRAEVKDLQPFYLWNSHRAAELRVGASVLREALERESEKEQRSTRAKQDQKAQVELQAKQIKLAFEDDRKRRALHDKMEKERREALAAAGGVAHPPAHVHPHPHPHPHPALEDDEAEDDESEDDIPGSFSAFRGPGHRLDNPPPYVPSTENDSVPNTEDSAQTAMEE
ncbi:hypothetical protein M422DRAFT_22814 [Sphaerobolus stellatus SS14]|nr:hypothetical protein M422DRAFT_22814 [Sphaerobolus stellatus SS14]